MNQYCIFCDSVHEERVEPLTKGVYKLLHVDSFLKDVEEIDDDALIIINDFWSAIRMADKVNVFPLRLKEALISELERASKIALAKDWVNLWLEAEEAKLKVYKSL